MLANVNAMGPGQEMQTLCRNTLRYDLEERLLADVLNPQGGNFFMANLKGPIFSKRLLYFVDPQGAFEVAPEEVGLLTSADGSYDVTLGFRSEAQRTMARAKDNTTFRDQPADDRYDDREERPDDREGDGAGDCE